MSQTLSPNRLFKNDAPRGVDALRDYLNGTVILTEVTHLISDQWPASPTSHRGILNATAAIDTDNPSRKMDWYILFLTGVNELVSPETDLVRGNAMSKWMSDETLPDGLAMTITEKRAMSSWYASLQSLNIWTREDEERTKDPRQGHHMQGIFRVNRHALNAALADPKSHCPKAMRTKVARPVITDDMRKPAIVVPEYNDTEGSLF